MGQPHHTVTTLGQMFGDAALGKYLHVVPLLSTVAATLIYHIIPAALYLSHQWVVDIVAGALLLARKFPPGSEIIFSAVTIPDMVRIVEAHDLVAVPVDLQENSLASNIAASRGRM
jgi:hypothetical protein